MSDADVQTAPSSQSGARGPAGNGEGERVVLPPIPRGGILRAGTPDGDALGLAKREVAADPAQSTTVNPDRWQPVAGNTKTNLESGKGTWHGAPVPRRHSQSQASDSPPEVREKRPHRRQDTLAAESPFKMPPVSATFSTLDGLRRAELMRRQDMRQGPLSKRTTLSHEAKIAGAGYLREGRVKTREIDEYIVQCAADGRSVNVIKGKRKRPPLADDLSEDEASDEASGQIQFRDPEGSMIDRERIVDYVQKKRDMFLLEYALKIKHEELAKLDELYHAEERKLQARQVRLRDDYQLFQEFLKENDRTAVDAIKRADEVSRSKFNVVAKGEKLRTNIASIKNEISKNDDQIEIYLQYANFLERVAPKEWSEGMQEKRRDLAMQMMLKQRQDATVKTYQDALRSPSQSKAVGSPSTNRASRPPPLTSRRSMHGSGSLPASKLAGGKPSTAQGTSHATNGVSGNRKTPAADASRGKTRDGARSRVSADAPMEVPTEMFEKLTLDLDSSEEASLFFQTPREMLDVYVDLEERNLSLIQNGQETEEVLESLKKKITAYGKKMSEQMESMNHRAQQLRKQLKHEEEAMADVRLRMAMFSHKDSEGKEIDTTDALVDLEKRVATIYKSSVGMNEANLKTTQMLTAVEARLHQLFDIMGKMPATQLAEAERAKDKERRQRVKDEQIAEAKRVNDERIQRALNRAKAAPKRQIGRRPMFRSRPAETGDRQAGEQSHFDPNEEENKLLFS